MGLFDSKNNFCDNLRKYRTLAGYTQAELAAKLGMTRQNYIRYESETTNAQPTIEMLCRLAEILNTDVNSLVGFKASIDLETAYKLFNVTVRKNNVDFVYNVSLNTHDEIGFNSEPYEKEITITLPVKEFNKILMQDYKIAYEHTQKMKKHDIDSYFTATVKQDMYYRYLIGLLNNIKTE